MFSRVPIRIFSLLLFHINYHSFIALEKCKKGCNMLEIILVQGFCPLKIKITQFPNGFRRNFIQKSVDWTRKKCLCGDERVSVLRGLNGRVFQSNKESCPY